MHLDLLGDPLSPAERAHLLGNDPEAIAAAYQHDAEQEQLWSADALLDASADRELSQVDLDEARSWAISAGESRRALDVARIERREPTAFSFAAELAEIRRHEREWLRVHIACDLPWNKTEECPEHGALIIAGRARQHQATLALREAVRKATASADSGSPSSRHGNSHADGRGEASAVGSFIAAPHDADQRRLDDESIHRRC